MSTTSDQPWHVERRTSTMNDFLSRPVAPQNTMIVVFSGGAPLGVLKRDTPLSWMGCLMGKYMFYTVPMSARTIMIDEEIASQWSGFPFSIKGEYTYVVDDPAKVAQIDNLDNTVRRKMRGIFGEYEERFSPADWKQLQDMLIQRLFKADWDIGISVDSKPSIKVKPPENFTDNERQKHDIMSKDAVAAVKHRFELNDLDRRHELARKKLNEYIRMLSGSRPELLAATIVKDYVDDPEELKAVIKGMEDERTMFVKERWEMLKGYIMSSDPRLMSVKAREAVKFLSDISQAAASQGGQTAFSAAAPAGRIEQQDDIDKLLDSYVEEEDAPNMKHVDPEDAV